VTQKTIRTIETICETDEFLLLKSAPGFLNGWCPTCKTQVIFMRPDLAASATGVSLREIFRRIEAGEVHCRETQPNSLFVCLNSIN